MKIPSAVHRYKVVKTSPQRTSDYPNLKLMFDMTND